MGQQLGKNQTIGGKDVTIVKQIGTGGFAEILLCKSIKTKDRYALKRMHVHADDIEKNKLARWEYELHQRLPKHPNIVACEGATTFVTSQGDKEYLMLLEYCPNGTLLDWINDHSNKTIQEILTIFLQIIQGLSIFHSHRPPISHRDLKPENVLKKENGTYALCDFGSSTMDTYLCKTNADRVEIGKIIEKNTTPSYRAPEMCDLYMKERIDQQADIWALGVIFYTMLFRTQPFPDGTLAIINGKYNIPENHKWPTKVIQLLQAMLTVSPSKRINIHQLQAGVCDALGLPPPTPTPSWSMLKAPPQSTTAATPTNAGAAASGAVPASSPSPAAATPVSNVSSKPSKSKKLSQGAIPVPAPASASAEFGDDDFNPSFPDPAAGISPTPIPAVATPTHVATPAMPPPPPKPPVPTSASNSALNVPQPVPEFQSSPVSAVSTSSSISPSLERKPSNITTPINQPTASPSPPLSSPPSSAATALMQTAASDEMQEPVQVRVNDNIIKEEDDIEDDGEEEAGSDDDTDSSKKDPAKQLLKYLKKITKDDIRFPKPKYIKSLLNLSWNYRSDVLTVQQQQLAQHGKSMSIEEIARSILGWEGLPTLFQALSTARPIMKSGNVAYKSLYMIHKCLQYGSPALIGQTFLNKKVLEELENNWTKEMTRSVTDDSPVHDMIAPYSKYLLHRLTCHQLHPHYEGNFSLGHYMWSLARHSTWPTGWNLSYRLARDDVHHMLQLLSEGLKLGYMIVCIVPGNNISEKAIEFRESVLIPLCEDLRAIYYACSFMLTQLCLITGSKNAYERPMTEHTTTTNIQNNNISTSDTEDGSFNNNTSTGTIATLPPVVPPQANAIEGTPPENEEEDSVLKTMPTLIAAHKTITERMYAFFVVIRDIPVVDGLKILPDLPRPVNVFHLVPHQYYPVPSNIPITGKDNMLLVNKFQLTNQLFGSNKLRWLLVGIYPMPSQQLHPMELMLHKNGGLPPRPKRNPINVDTYLDKHEKRIWKKNLKTRTTGSAELTASNVLTPSTSSSASPASSLPTPSPTTAISPQSQNNTVSNTPSDTTSPSTSLPSRRLSSSYQPPSQQDLAHSIRAAQLEAHQTLTAVANAAALAAAQHNAVQTSVAAIQRDAEENPFGDVTTLEVLPDVATTEMTSPFDNPQTVNADNNVSVSVDDPFAQFGNVDSFNPDTPFDLPMSPVGAAVTTAIPTVTPTSDDRQNTKSPQPPTTVDQNISPFDEHSDESEVEEEDEQQHKKEDSVESDITQPSTVSPIVQSTNLTSSIVQTDASAMVSPAPLDVPQNISSATHDFDADPFPPTPTQPIHETSTVVHDDGNPFGTHEEQHQDNIAPQALAVAALEAAVTEDNPFETHDNPFGTVSTSSTSTPVQQEALPDEIEYSELTFEERIGVGAAAEVYSGEWRSSEVAIKKFFDKHFNNPEAVQEFRQEIQLLRLLRHPNIILFMAACTKPPHMCLVTELLAGSLFDLLHNSNVPLMYKLRVQLALDSAKGMSYLHLYKPQILHRDLKSPNILLDSGRKAKICDFGVAKFQTAGAMGGMTGTLQWMAPEIMDGSSEYTAKADVYSFGIILWELISRCIPFRSMNAAQISIQVLTKQYRPAIPEYCPQKYKELIELCWATDPSIRPTFPQIVDRLTELMKEIKTDKVLAESLGDAKMA